MQEALKWVMIADVVQPKDRALITEHFTASCCVLRGNTAVTDLWGCCQVGEMRTAHENKHISVQARKHLLKNEPWQGVGTG